MNFSLNNARAQKVWFDEDNLWLLLVDGRQLSVPKICFDKFQNASESDLSNYELMGEGVGIYWENLDEDLYVPNLLLGITSTEKTDRIA